MVLKDLITRNVPARRETDAHPLARIQNEMNRIFDRFFDDFRLGSSSDLELSTFPKVDIKETKKDIQVSAELPGLDAKDIDISVTDNVLTLRGEKSQENKQESENYFHVERSYGRFHRAIALPAEVESDNVKAEYKSGVLKIKLHKKTEAQQKAKKIDIKVS